MDFLLRDKKIKWLLFFAIINLLICFFARWPITPSGDSISYYEATRFIRGEEMEEGFDLSGIYNRLLTAPLFIFLTGIFSFVFGIYGSMLFINIFFYLAAVVFFYLLAKEILQNGKAAFFSSFFIFLNYDIINFGIAHLTDMAGWAFFIAASFFAARYFNSQEKKNFWLAIIFSSVGALFKEYGGLGIISLIFLIGFSSRGKKLKIKEISTAIFSFLSVVVAYHLFFYFYFGYSYFDWYGFNLNYYLADPASRKNSYDFVLLIKVLGWLYLAGWPVFTFGLFKILKEKLNKEGAVFLALLPASLSFLIWPVMTQRIAFVLVPWLALVSGFGLSKIKSDFILIPAILFYAFFSYYTGYLMEAINVPI